MDSTSQTSADDEFGRSCSCSTLSDTTFGVSNGCCAKDIIDKLMVQFKEKDKQYKEDIKKLFMAYDCEKARANEASAAMVEIANDFHTLPDSIFDKSTEYCDQDDDMLDKFVVKLQEKEKQLEEKKQANEELVANLNLEKVRAVEATPAGTDELKTELAIAHKTIDAFQMAFWKSFPSPHHFYHIKVPSENGGYGYLYANNSGYLCSSTGGLKGYFKFTKDIDGTFSIYSNSKTKYLQIQTSSGTSTTSASVMFCAYVDNKSKFAPIFHPQPNKQQPEPGILIDIYSLANGCFLSTEVDMQNRLVSNRNRSSAEVNHQNRLVVVANSPIAPANKFLILAADVA